MALQKSIKKQDPKTAKYSQFEIFLAYSDMLDIKKHIVQLRNSMVEPIKTQPEILKP